MATSLNTSGRMMEEFHTFFTRAFFKVNLHFTINKVASVLATQHRIQHNDQSHADTAFENAVIKSNLESNSRPPQLNTFTIFTITWYRSMLPLSPFLLLLIASSLLAVCRAFTFEAAGSTACPTQAARNFSTDCASDCLHHPSCNGFTWNPSDRSCTLAFNLPPPASTGACKLYLRPNINALRQRCLLYTSPSPRDLSTSRMPSSA